MRPAAAVLLIPLCLWTAGAAAAAGDPPSARPPAERAATLTETMKTRLGLSDQQAAQVLAINEQAATEVDAAVGQYQRRELRKQVKSINAARDARLGEVLTPEQFRAWQDEKRAIMKQVQERAKSKRAIQGAAPDG